MRIAVAALLAAATLALAHAASAADEPYTAQPQIDKPGRAADEVKAGGASTHPGRTVEEDPQSAMSERDKPGHAIDDGMVRTGGDTARPGRQAEEKQ